MSASPTATATTTKSKSQLAYELVHDRILDGGYAPGTRLVLEPIGREIGASVVPVREALRRLEAEGLVTFERNVGARVAEMDEIEYLDTMQTLAFVEGAAVSLAAPLLSRSDVDRAAEVNERMRALLPAFDALEFTLLNERFHRVLSDVCPNPHLTDLVDRGWKRLGRLRRTTFGFVPERAAASVAEHRDILDRIVRGDDPREIELAVREHRLATPHAYLHRAAADHHGTPTTTTREGAS